ncbi:sortase [Nocardioides anomalus]|uniref:Sortase n=1 Tax=Nocardioides anomalus TaxID=2712223 RepID=A0A6G6W9T3_9ACTN|nr:sortase [Nocardioides anomalus]QIG41982.1 sortase [Nocardioides anomalus]
MAGTLSPAAERPFDRFASGFGRVAAVLSVLGVLVALGLSVPSAWWDALGPGGDGAAAPTYTRMTPADPVRVAAGGPSGVRLVSPLVKSTVEPRAALAAPPDDAPLVSWWDGSARAGAAQGQTILIGHVAGGHGGLTQLGEMAEGDTVDLLTERGTMRYQVSTVRTFDPTTMDRVGLTLFKQDGGAGRLVMISAGGWDGAAYQRSVVVTAAPLGRPTD